MITVRVPFRISLGGGGTDLPSYYTKHEGYVITSAINRYMYVNINESATSDKIKLYYDRVEIHPVTCLSNIQHEIIRETLRYYNIQRPLEIASMADIEAGTGMGSSSSFTVGLIKGLSVLLKENYTLQSLAEMACMIEIGKVEKKIGKQDQYIAAYGGIQELEIFKSGRVAIRAVKLNKEFISELERRIVLFYTNIRRPTAMVLDSQSDSIKKQNKNVVEAMHKIKQIGHEVKEALVTENINDLGLIFDDHWREKRKLAPKMTSYKIDKWYSTAMHSGAIGGKLIGAGGGGFLLFVTKEDKRKELIRTMIGAGLKFMDFRFDFDGVKVIHND